MRRSHRRRVTAACALSVLVVSAVCLAATAFADEGESARPAERGDGLPIAELEKRLNDNPITFLVMLLSRFGPLVPGLILLTLWFLRREKIRAGLLPPPPEVESNVPFNLGGALVLIGAMVLAMFLIGSGLALRGGWTKPADIPAWASIVSTGIPIFALAVLVVLRRRRMAMTSPELRVAQAGLFAAPMGASVYPAPKPARALRLGLWGLCVGYLIVIPAMFGAVLLLQSLGVEPELQRLVQQAVQDPDPTTTWLIAGFGVFVAPFAEESVFRGLLYPALKQALGGGSRGAWISAVIISAGFAMVHDSWAARIPLFALAMVLARIFEKTNSLAAVCWLHAFHNLLSLVPLILLRYSS